MKKDIKIIALDLDGTTFNDKKEITPRTKAAFRAALDQGIIVMPATGRPIVGLPKEFMEIKGVRYALTANGALVVDLYQDNKVIYQDCINADKGIELLTELMELDAHIDIYHNGQGYATKESLEKAYKYMFEAHALQYLLDTRIIVDDLIGYIKANNLEIEKINLYFADMELRANMMDTLSKRGDCLVSTAIVNNVEINSKTANKGRALLAFSQALGIPREQIMVCGDGGNDIEMLKSGGFSVVMDNARDEIKQYADYITKSNEEDGVAYAIEQFVL